MNLLTWWNLIFVLPFSAALIYILFQAFTGLGMEHGGDIDHDIGVDVDHDVDLDMDHDTDLGVDHDVEHHFGVEHSTEFGHADDTSAIVKALSFLGIGRVPISIVFMTFCFIWGFTGWMSNMVLAPILRYPVIFIWPSIGIALFSTLLFTRWTVKGLSKIMPSTETYGTSNAQLAGRRGKAFYEITETSGCVRLHDDYGNLLDLACRVKPGDDPIPSGSSVILMRYDVQKQVFLVKHDLLSDQELPTNTQEKG